MQIIDNYKKAFIIVEPKEIHSKEQTENKGKN